MYFKKKKPTVDGVSSINYISRLRRDKALPTPPKKPQDIGRFQNLISLFSAGIFLVIVFFGITTINQGQSLQKEVLGEATAGYEYLNKARGDLANQDLGLANQNFLLASESFEEALEDLNVTGGFIGKVVGVFPQGRDAVSALKSAELISEAMAAVTRGFDRFSELELGFDSSTNSTGRDFFSGLRESRLALLEGHRKLAEAAGLLESVETDNLPPEFVSEFSNRLTELSLTVDVLQNLVNLNDVLIKLLGGENKEYVVVFQNNDEMRATGGFIGTYGSIKFENGQMRIEKIESIYHIAGQLKENIAPPVPIARKLNDRFNIQDSNWFVDFPLSARNILEFYELTTGRLADGVIAMTPDVFEGLLDISGPVILDRFGETLTSENFRERVQFKTSIDYDKEENRPKKLLSDFAPVLLSQLSDLPEQKFLNVFNHLTKMASQKQILVFSLDEKVQDKVSQIGLAGEIKPTQGDYLGIFHSSVGGGKTSQSVNSKVSKTVQITEGGGALVTVSILRTHSGFFEKFFPRNVDYMRVLIPSQALIVEASGFDRVELNQFVKPGFLRDSDVAFWESSQQKFGQVLVGQEAGYTMIGGWLELDPGESKAVEVVYKLPLQTDQVYTNLLQKQAGSQPFEFTLSVLSPNKPIYLFPERGSLTHKGAAFSEIINSDRLQAVIFE